LIEALPTTGKTDEDLQAEYEYRTKHGEPVPEYLE